MGIEGEVSKGNLARLLEGGRHAYLTHPIAICPLLSPSITVTPFGPPFLSYATSMSELCLFSSLNSPQMLRGSDSSELALNSRTPSGRHKAPEVIDRKLIRTQKQNN